MSLRGFLYKFELVIGFPIGWLLWPIDSFLIIAFLCWVVPKIFE